MENIMATFNFMKMEGIKIVNIDSTDIIDGNMKLTLGLIWTLIFNYQVIINRNDPHISVHITWVNILLIPDQQYILFDDIETN